MLRLTTAYIPTLNDRSDSLTVTRRADEVGYVSRYRSTVIRIGEEDVEGPDEDFVVLAPPYLGRNTDPQENPTPSMLNLCRHQRNSSYPHFVNWHQGEYPPCPQALRSSYFLRPPSWWSTVEVPYGALVELPPVQAYATGDLRHNKASAWAIFRSEWDVLAGAALVDVYRQRRVAWLYPPRLRAWIRAVGYSIVCRRADGDDDEEAVDILAAILDLLDQLPHTTEFLARLGERALERRDRRGWVRVSCREDGGALQAFVDEDLPPFNSLPYSAEVVSARDYPASDWDAAVANRAVTRRAPPPATQPPPPPRVTNAVASAPREVVPAPPPVRIVTVDRVTHRDVDDVAFDELYLAIPGGVARSLARFFARDAAEVQQYSAGFLLSALVHLLIRREDEVVEAIERIPGVPPEAFASLLHAASRRRLGDLFIRKVQVATADGSRRRDSRGPSWHDQRGGPAKQRFRYGGY
ncbi:hypothetical protein MMPV_001850 [Pyropia vietnamensis]